MTTLWIARGLPASGKTTWARQQLAGRVRGSIIRLNRDDLRRMGLPNGYGKPEHDAERSITTMRNAALGALLTFRCDVICDDTNLRSKYVRELMLVARHAAAAVEIVDFTHVPLDECIRRDRDRSGPEQVGEDVIRAMHTRYLAQHHGKPLPIPEPPDAVKVTPYVPPLDAPKAVLCDVDGTVALMVDRGPYDETRVGTDQPNKPVIETLWALIAAGHHPVFMSGRSEKCREATTAWLLRHIGTPWVSELHMRAAGDTRPDTEVKLELFNTHIRDRYDVRVVLDDRDSVVRLWRSLGMTCLQVAPGDF